MFVFLTQNHVRVDYLFAVISGLVNYLGPGIMFAGIYFWDLNMVMYFTK